MQTTAELTVGRKVCNTDDQALRVTLRRFPLHIFCISPVLSGELKRTIERIDENSEPNAIFW